MENLEKRRIKIIGKTGSGKCGFLVQCQGKKRKRVLHNGQKAAVSQFDLFIDAEVIAVVGKRKRLTYNRFSGNRKFGRIGFRFAGRGQQGNLRGRNLSERVIRRGEGVPVTRKGQSGGCRMKAGVGQNERKSRDTCEIVQKVRQAAVGII